MLVPLKNLKPFLFLIILALLILSQGFVNSGFGQHLKDVAEPEQFRGDYAIKDEQFAIWNGANYVPVFIKGINLGVSVPGTQPGQLAATAEDYSRWFDLIKEAGYNCIRLYTLHYPRFYHELRQYNLENPQNPLLVIHGIWLKENETLSDLFLQTDSFDQEIREVVAAVHGDITIDERLGQAHGNFTSDISPWVIGFLPGREIFPDEVALTNQNNPGETTYEGAFFQIPAGDPVEIWITQRLDGLMQYENEHYQAVRPTGFSSWPTLDPITHPTEHILLSTEDTEKIDLANVVSTDSSAGFFIGYHAYPYYPDFIVHDPYYLAESDAAGPNNYLGYLKDLKAHYQGIPLIIAEFGVPSSWGSGHYSPSGMHHGSHSEEQQGIYSIRMLDNIEESGCAGGIQFSLIDEWFKQTWITNPYSDKQYRHLWHNITAPEQNFGILAYAPPPEEPFTETGSYPGSPISSIEVHSDYTFFSVRVHMKPGQYRNDTLWVAFDTYESNLGESILPDGRSIGVGSDTLRAEFALQIPLGGDLARLFVTPGYDVYGIKSLVRLDTVISTSTDNGLWNPVRWKTNYTYNRTQYIGELAISNSDDPYQFLNAVSLFNDSLEIRIPWTLLNFPAPTVGRAMHYLSRMEGAQIVIQQQDTLSDGISLTLCLQDEIYQTSKYTWSPWDYEKIVSQPPIERKKQSFHYMKRMLPQFNSPPIGMADSFHLYPGNILETDSKWGLLQNDFDIDGNEMHVQLSFGSGPAHGNLYLHPDGSFLYEPDQGFKGDDFFMYYLEDGTTNSTLVPVQIHVGYPLSEDAQPQGHYSIFPNPGKDRFCITLPEPFQEAYLKVVDMLGKEIVYLKLEEATNWVVIQNTKPGVYLFILYVDQNLEQFRIIMQ
jgi:hypothetical protein